MQSVILSGAKDLTIEALIVFLQQNINRVCARSLTSFGMTTRKIG